MNVMRDAQLWDQNNVHCAYKYAYVVRTNMCTLCGQICVHCMYKCAYFVYMCTVDFQRDDCVTMQMFVDALPRLAINGKIY